MQWMAAGQSGKPMVGAIIQARMKSERLPGKIVMPLPHPSGKPLLSWIVTSAQRSAFVTTVTIATSTESENDILESFSADHHINVFRGSENNVLSRYMAVARDQKLDVIIRLTADNPIVDTGILDKVIDRHIRNKNDYTHTTGLPGGMNFEVVSAAVLLSLENEVLSPPDQEHVTLFIRNNPKFRKEEVTFFKDEQLSNLRLTVDYPSDFAALSVIFAQLQPDESPGLDFVRRIKAVSPWMFEVNEANIQKKPNLSYEVEMAEAQAILRKLEFYRAAQKLEDDKA